VHNDVLLENYHAHLKEMRREIEAQRAGARPSGLSTGIEDLDRNWGGLLPGQLILLLGRTGEGKSYKALKFALSAKLQGATVLVFTPEMSPHEVRCRLHTLASALPEIQQACGLRHSFRNKDLLHRRPSFSLAAYERFCRHFKEELPGKIRLIAQTRRGEQMSVAYVQDRIEALAPGLVIIDPIYLLKPVQTYRDNPYMEVGRTCEAIEQLCERYNIPFVITNQSHRQGSLADAPDKNKSFGSDIPAQLADYVLGVKHISEAHVMHCRCTKARWGDTFRYQMRFNANTGTLYVQEPDLVREEE
jgi:replicative DNA helicase